MLPLILALAGTGMQMGGNIAGSLATRQAEKQNARDAKINQIMSYQQAAEVQAMAEQQVGDLQKEGETLKSAQVASMAAQGVDVSSGVTQDLLTDTNTKVAEDVRRIRVNARKEAWALQAQGMQYKTQGDRAKSRGRYALMGGLLGASASGTQGLAQAYPYLPKSGGSAPTATMKTVEL
jgi:hypothetical protein